MDEHIYPGLFLKYDYVLLKKIGGGRNAVVWMVYRIKDAKYYAMKIQDYQCYNDGCREVKIIMAINEYMLQNPDIHCIQMIDYFVHSISVDEDDDSVSREESEGEKQASDGGNNTHEYNYVCSLYKLYAGSLQSLLNVGKYKYGLPIKVVKNITRQLLTALHHIHDNLKIIHTDVKPENILFKGIIDDYSKIIDSFEKSGFEEKYKTILQNNPPDDPDFVKKIEDLAIVCVEELLNLNTRFDNEEELDPDDENDDLFMSEEDDFSYSTESSCYEEECLSNESHTSYENVNSIRRIQSVSDFFDEEDNIVYNLDATLLYDFKNVLNNFAQSSEKDLAIVDDKYVRDCYIDLIDFGNSYFYDKKTLNEIQDRCYRAPEVILDLNYGYACDIWSVGCIVFELVTGFVLFDPEDYPLNKDIQHLYLFEKMLGPLPTSMKKKSKRSFYLFDKDNNYHLRNVEPFERINILERLTEQFLIPEKKAKKIVNFLNDCFVYKPYERKTALQLLSHEWLR